MCRQASLAILVCADPGLEKYPGYWVQDCSAAVQNILLEAVNQNLGAVWLGVYPKPVLEPINNSVESIVQLMHDKAITEEAKERIPNLAGQVVITKEEAK